MEILPLVLLAPVLIAVGYFDLRYMRIPDILSVIVLAVFVAMTLFFPPADFWARLMAAGAVFLVGLAGFAFRLIGGGDVKLLSALMLVIPTGGILVFANLFSLSLLLGIVLVLALRRLPRVKRLGWKTFGGSHKFPMGISIAMAGLSFPFVSLVVQAG